MAEKEDGGGAAAGRKRGGRDSEQKFVGRIDREQNGRLPLCCVYGAQELPEVADFGRECSQKHRNWCLDSPSNVSVGLSLPQKGATIPRSVQ